MNEHKACVTPTNQSTSITRHMEEILTSCLKHLLTRCPTLKAGKEINLVKWNITRQMNGSVRSCVNIPPCLIYEQDSGKVPPQAARTRIPKNFQDRKWLNRAAQFWSAGSATPAERERAPRCTDRRPIKPRAVDNHPSPTQCRR